MSDDRFPHLIAAWDVGVDESLTEDHAELLKLRTFDDTDRLRTCVSTKEYEIMVTYLIICKVKRTSCSKNAAGENDGRSGLRAL
jgi:hypothetical protein